MRAGENGPRTRVASALGATRPHGALAFPLALIVAIVLADVLAPAEVHLGALLVVAPAVTASFAGPLATCAIGALAVGAQVATSLQPTPVAMENVVAHTIAITVITALVSLARHLQDQRASELGQVRRVSVAAQQAVLRPLPRRVGPLNVQSLYLAAEDHALIGGDLYAAVRTSHSTRLLIGDVMGKGITAMGDAALLLGVFREAAPRITGLGELMAYLDARVSASTAETARPEETTEFFTTAAVVEVPDAPGPALLINSGHVPALLHHGGRVLTCDTEPDPPLGLGLLGTRSFRPRAYAFDGDDVILLCTDGITEARDPDGAFFPLAQRAAEWTWANPESVVRQLRHDLQRHVRGALQDDAAVVAVQRNGAGRSDPA
ncbi:hypothetical protein GCM10018793_09470 [Streptomyces sulfonofaciens]|uniref:PPM-type phosphatase domain-containing protein n=1 Tax=Streptomyces sulfonofaciens TaxID=68272 RepID=A0A919FV03_9ACTN|nr:PP2C family protein-serine/threonine phosphatase [Streptomyces sulfonofaciens]GHH72451.1 hypothetical protein GCM10018793_09470 [Streptomyces sulfonofaciens]